MRLIQGDCLEVMKQLADEGVKVDLVLTDPPYGTTDCKWDTIIPFNEMWDCLSKLTNPNTPILLFGSEPFSTMLRYSNIDNFKYDWVWHKNTSGGFVQAKKMPLKYHEIISVFYKKPPLYNPQFREYAEASKGKTKPTNPSQTNRIMAAKNIPAMPNYERGAYPKSIIEFKSESIIKNSKKRSYHPTLKPVALLEYLIKTYTNSGDLVLDFTMGSGSTGVACYNTGRDFIGIELDEDYYNIATKRIREAQGQSKLDVFDKNKVKV
ncbi:DNA adenine methyltransferase YhdJ [bioreactor metagenome]|uniref:DNA adenine methyltransferase YhdJ n=1 Tax=bioreactor metagenome TaxID=1076179 RepID=A0A644T527_9ZZZZ|nr:DNA methyltransferase [Methanobrevibacter sp.]MEA4956914.1 DNA methyltransferase [Methanobrevibacter sp.]